MTRIEQQLTILLRRVQRIHAPTDAGEVELDRSAYGIMCRLADEGPHRLGSLAHVFGLDPSTITRQVQSLEHAGWAQRHPDPTDRRAAILDLTDDGRELLRATRERRRQWLRQALSDWPERDQEEFGRLLAKFNGSLDELRIVRGSSEPDEPDEPADTPDCPDSPDSPEGSAKRPAVDVPQ